ncbi:hypothetical protein LTR28_000884, partial [Elasticomyces elasticus]
MAELLILRSQSFGDLSGYTHSALDSLMALPTQSISFLSQLSRRLKSSSRSILTAKGEMPS